MVVPNDAFWAHLDSQIAASHSVPPALAVVKTVSLGSVTAPKEEARDPGPAPKSGVADWTGVLDTISAAKAVAREQDARLREQDTACEVLTADLQRALQEVQTLKALLEDVKAQSEARAVEVHAQADERVREVEGKAHMLVRKAEERTQHAVARAEAAESWLGRIEKASRDLLGDTRRAAA